MAFEQRVGIWTCALTMLLSSTVGASAHTFGDACWDKARNAMAFMVEFDFADQGPGGAWRTFFEVDVDVAKSGSGEPLVVNGPAGRYFVHHCPSGQFIKVTDFKVLYTYDEDRGIVIRREASAMRLKSRLDDVARKILDDDEKQPLTDLVGHYETSGYSAEFGRTTVLPCGCPLIDIPTIVLD